MDEAQEHETLSQEDGRISLLMLALSMIVFALVALGVVVTSLHLQRQQLQATADQAAVTALIQADGSYYTQSAADQALARKRVEDLLARSPLGAEAVRLVDLRVSTTSASLRVKANLSVPLVAYWFGRLAEATVDSSAVAR